MHDEEDNAQPTAIEIRSYFVRERNALAVRGHFGELYTDYYLHWMQHGVSLSPLHDTILKEGLTAFTLYLASRPWKEATAWTANFVDPRINVFLTGSSLEQTVVGRVFTEDIRPTEQSLLYSDVRIPDTEPRQSIIEFEGNAFFKIAEHFHAQSDQRIARFFEFAPEDYVLIAAQPECDLEWLTRLDSEAVRALDQREQLALLETRHYRFHCGCSLDRLAPALAPLSAGDLDALFDGDESIRIHCPRCAAVFNVTRDQIEALGTDAGDSSPR